jgi:hypothetical protein
MKPQTPVFDGVWRANSVIAPVDRQSANDMIRRHYLKKWPGVCVMTLGLFCYGDLRGVIVFSLPPRETFKRYGGLTWELGRLWVSDEVPANAETYLIGRAVRYIRQTRRDVKALVSYADPSVGHRGTIYKAANWTADGRTDDDRKTPRFDYADAVTGKRYSRKSHVPPDAVIVRVPRVSKHRFSYALA